MWRTPLGQRRDLTWNSLNRLGNSAVLRSSYFWIVFVPIVAKVMAPIDSFAQVEIFGYVWNLEIGLPFSWKLFFFAALAFSLASLIYSSYCPEIVRDYQSFNEFREQGKGSSQITRALAAAKPDSTTITSFLESYCDDAETDLSSSDYLQRAVIHEGRLADAFWFVQEYSDLSRPALRLSLWFLYSIGFALLLAVLLENIVYVVRYA